MAIKCSCPLDCKIHDQCECGKIKQRVSNCCRNCFKLLRSKCCTKCNENKALSLFPKRKDSLDGRRNQCTACYHTYSKDCCSCGNEKSKKAGNCIDCKLSVCLEDTRPIEQFTYRTNKDPNHFSRIRRNAQNVATYLKLREKGCVCCGLNVALDVCHIKPLKDFDLDTPINVVNHPNNLEVRCKICHWLHDKRGMSDDEILDYLKNHFRD